MTSLLDMQSSPSANAEHTTVVTADQMLSRIGALAPLIERLTPEMEQARRLPAELVSALKSARVYSMLLPRRYGGLEMDAPSAFRAITALARLDGSVGWNAMIGSLGSLFPFLVNRTVCEDIFKDDKDHIIAGSSHPAGQAERIAGGWRVSGSWPLASGCHHAEWIAAGCVMMEDGSPIAAGDAPGPMIRTCLVPAKNFEIHDTWHALGLRGTGSHHVALTDVLVPEQNFFEFPFGTSFAPNPIFARLAEIVVLSHAAHAVGIAEGAMIDLVLLARTGLTQRFATTPLVETERFREGLGRLDAELKAARALLEAEISRIWHNPAPPTDKTLARLAEPAEAAIWITAASLRVAEGCFELAATRAVYESSPLQRRLRDLRVAAQHVAVHPRNYVLGGENVLARLS